jgi:HEAT repeat protein
MNNPVSDGQIKYINTLLQKNDVNILLNAKEIILTNINSIKSYLKESVNEYNKSIIINFIIQLKNVEDIDIIKLLISLFEHSDWEIRKVASDTIAEIGQKTIPYLLPLLKDKNSKMRYRTLVILGKILDPKTVLSLTDPSHIATSLIYALRNDISYDVRVRAIFNLGQLGGEKAVDALLHTLSDENDSIRKNAITALGKIGTKEALPALDWLAENDHTEVGGGLDGIISDSAKKAIRAIQDRNKNA